jgi:lysozyme family protein
MADFKKALAIVLANEGFYNNLKQDTGGETYCGVARNSFPDWEGWKAIDKYKSEFGQPAFGLQIHSADQYVEAFYEQNFWRPVCGDAVALQAHANLIFDIAVNCGVKGAGMMVQEVLRDCFGHLDITLDGVLGTKSVAAINAHKDGTLFIFGLDVPNAYLFMVQLTAVRMKRYARLAKGGSAWAIPGWTARSFSFLGSK